MVNRIARFLNRLLLIAILDLEFINLESAPRDGGLIVAGNHLGVLDALIVFYVVDQRDYIVLVAEYHRRYFLRRMLVKAANALFVDRYQADFAVLREVIRRLNNGGVLMIAPEGTRSKTGGLQAGQPGTAYLAAKTGFPVLPVGIVGSQDRLILRNLKRLRRTPVKVRIGDPIYFQSVSRKDRGDQLQTYTDEIMCQIAALLPEGNRGVYTNHRRLKEILFDKGT